MKFIVNSSGLETDFSELKDPVAFLDSIKNSEILIKEAWHKQEEFNRYLKKIGIGNKSEKQKNTLANINKLFDGRNDTIKFVDDYNSMILEAKRKAAEEQLELEPWNAKTKHKKSPLEFQREFYNETENDEKNINEQIFKEFINEIKSDEKKYKWANI